MKDKVARHLIDQLADTVGCRVSQEHHVLTAAYQLETVSPGGDAVALIQAEIVALRRRIVVLEEESIAKKESLRPVCKTCGQKIQDGFLPGQIESISAAVRKTDRGRK